MYRRPMTDAAIRLLDRPEPAPCRSPNCRCLSPCAWLERQTVCFSCDGTGAVDCPVCDGEGTEESADGEIVDCEVCNGSGAVECGDCYGEGVTQ